MSFGCFRSETYAWVLDQTFKLTGVLLQATAPDLAADLNESSLVILKGDLNYRKLLADRQWPYSTGVHEACGNFLGVPYLSLRTLKVTC